MSGVVEILELGGHRATGQAVYKWLAGECLPRLTHAAALVRHSGGSLTFDDIVDHWDAMRERRERQDDAGSEPD